MSRNHKIPVLPASLKHNRPVVLRAAVEKSSDCRAVADRQLIRHTLLERDPLSFITAFFHLFVNDRFELLRHRISRGSAIC